jgi:RND family efflux transporter MFP subunit
MNTIFNLFFLALLALGFISCGHDHSTPAQDGEDVKIQFTAYSADFELFAEADPFVAGQTSNILSHFTNLPSFKALESGKVTIRLLANGIETTQTLEHPTRKGIYSFDMKPETAGTGSLIFDIITQHGAFEVLVNDIIVFDKESEAAESDQANVSETNTVVFTKEQSWKIDFATEQVTAEPFGQVIKTTAQIQAAQGDEILVTAKTNGVLLFSSNLILEGKNVSKNQVLFTISGSGLANNNSAVRFTEAKNNFEKAELDYERTKALSKEKIVSEKELLTAKHHYDNARVVYENLNKNFSSAGENVSGPMDGFIKQLFVQNGQYVEAGQPIFSISQNKSLILEADVQQKYVSVLAFVKDANIRTLHDNKTYRLDELNGEVLSYGRSTNDNNYLIPVSLKIDNKGDFIPGSFVEVYLKTIANSQAIKIPNSALLEEQGIFFVYVQITPELFEKREVKPGATDGLRTEILTGLNSGERVISAGAIFVKLAQATGSLDAHSGHVH